MTRTNIVIATCFLPSIALALHLTSWLDVIPLSDCVPCVQGLSAGVVGACTTLLVLTTLIGKRISEGVEGLETLMFLAQCATNVSFTINILLPFVRNFAGLVFLAFVTLTCVCCGIALELREAA
jgi:hypothetical protein